MRVAAATLSAFIACFLVLAASEPTAADRTDAKEISFVHNLRLAEEKSRKREWAEAVGHWEKVTAANPVNGDYWEKYATALLSAKDYRRAIPAYQRALDLREGFPFNQAYNIACCYARLGEKEQAYTWLEKALAMGFRNLIEMRLDPDLETLREEERFRKLAGSIDTSKMPRNEGWRTDLAFLYKELQRKHFDPFRKVTRKEMDAYVRSLDRDIPKLTDDQVMVGFVKLMKMAGDGHTSIRPAEHKGAPVQFYQFEEGVFITAAAAEHADLLGARVLKVGDKPVEEVIARLEPLIARDNDMGLKAIGPGFLRVSRMLHGLGLVPSADELPITVSDSGGQQRAVNLPCNAGRPDANWKTLSSKLSGAPPLYLKNRQAPYWFEYLPESKTVYFQYNSVRNDSSEPLEKFCTRLFKFVNENEVEKLVIDLRWNGGGNTFLNQPIIHGLIKCEKINQKGKLFAIIGRQTFSAAQNCTVFLERHTNVIFAGEPSGSSPNFVGETVMITLPYSKMTGSISDLYWQSSWPMDYRTWIAPTLYAPPTFAAYRAQRDPALEVVLAYREDA